MRKQTDYRRLEHLVRGVSNHRRIQMLELIKREPGLDVMQLSKRVNIHFKTASVHLRRLFNAGHISKTVKGKRVTHQITARGLITFDYLQAIL